MTKAAHQIVAESMAEAAALVHHLFDKQMQGKAGIANGTVHQPLANGKIHTESSKGKGPHFIDDELLINLSTKLTAMFVAIQRCVQLLYHAHVWRLQVGAVTNSCCARSALSGNIPYVADGAVPLQVCCSRSRRAHSTARAHPTCGRSEASQPVQHASLPADHQECGPLVMPSWRSMTIHRLVVAKRHHSAVTLDPLHGSKTQEDLRGCRGVPQAPCCAK